MVKDSRIAKSLSEVGPMLTERQVLVLKYITIVHDRDRGRRTTYRSRLFTQLARQYFFAKKILPKFAKRFTKLYKRTNIPFDVRFHLWRSGYDIRLLGTVGAVLKFYRKLLVLQSRF